MVKDMLKKLETFFCNHIWVQEPYGYSGVRYVCIFCDKECFKKPRGTVLNDEGRVIYGKKKEYESDL